MAEVTIPTDELSVWLGAIIGASLLAGAGLLWLLSWAFDRWERSGDDPPPDLDGPAGQRWPADTTTAARSDLGARLRALLAVTR